MITVYKYIIRISFDSTKDYPYITAMNVILSSNPYEQYGYSLSAMFS